MLAKVLKKDEFTRKNFIGIFARDKLPNNPPFPSCFIFNTQPSGESGQHWLGLFINEKGYANFFDSFGNSESYFGLESYLFKNTNGWTSNQKRIQGSSDLCGIYCLLFLVHCSRNKLPQFYAQFSRNQFKNDTMLFKLLDS
jgi:hypothetical protein